MQNEIPPAAMVRSSHRPPSATPSMPGQMSEVATRLQQTPARHSGVRARLREATHRQHSRLNRHPMLAGLTKPGYPLAKYICMLSAYFQIYRALESKIDAMLERQPPAFDYERRRKLPWLAADLVYLTQALPARNTPTLRARSLPAMETSGQLIGLLYVIEGSTLGGQLISRSLAEHHGLTPGRGASFFGGYGDATLSLWEEFLCFAESIDGNEAECCKAEMAAGATFQLFEQNLDRCATGFAD